MRIEFTVPMEPVPQPRQRHRVVKPTDGSAVFARLFASATDTMVAYKKAVREALKATYATNYTPEKDLVNVFKQAVQLAFRVAYSGPPLDGPVGLSVLFVMPRPASKVWKRKPMPREWAPTAKADVDNLLKAVMDALNKRAWTDDRRVCEALPRKCIAAGDEKPHAEIRIESLEDIEPPQPGCGFDPTPAQRETRVLVEDIRGMF